MPIFKTLRHISGKRYLVENIVGKGKKTCLMQKNSLLIIYYHLNGLKALRDMASSPILIIGKIVE